MRPIVALGVSLIVLASGGARAAAPGADELIARGLELRRQLKPEQALETFQRAHALAPSARTLGQMGLVEASLERWLDAEAHLTASRADAADPWVRKNHAFLEQALAVAGAHVGELIVTGPDGTDVAIDGSHVGTLPAVHAIRLAEGESVVTASGTGFKDFSKTVKIVARAKVSLAIVLDPIDKRPAVALAAPAPAPSTMGDVSPAPPIAAAEHRRPAWRSWTGAGLVAAGAGLLGWGIAWIAIDGNDGCANRGPACTTVYNTKSAGWILAAGGAAAAAGGAALLLIGERREGAAGTSLEIAATPTSLSLNGHF